MGQASDSNRQSSLDDKKERAAGRQENSQRHAGNRDDFETQGHEGRVGGASGNMEEGHGKPNNLSKGGGGGGAGPAVTKD